MLFRKEHKQTDKKRERQEKDKRKTYIQSSM